jgi:hypothetical protein
MDAEQWSELSRRQGLACAWLHDIGRFTQFAEFGMFDDRKSVNHATRGVTVLHREGILDHLVPATQEIILVAVGCHNARELSPTLAPKHIPFVHLVRDADKLDIFRVFEEAIRAGDLLKHPEIALSLPLQAAVTPEVLDAISAGQPISYQQLRSVCDFVMIQVGWIASQIHSAAALAWACDHGALDFRESFVRSLDDSPEVRACFQDIRRSVQQRLDAPPPPRPS